MFFSYLATPRSDVAITDKTAPVVRFNISNADLANARSSGVLQLSADISDMSTIIRVEYLLDSLVVARSVEPPFRVSINIANLAPGEHTLQVIAYDAAGNRGESPIFTFIIHDDQQITPSDDESYAIVTRTIQPTAQETSVNGNTSENTNDDDDDETIVAPSRTAGGWWASLPTAMQVCSSSSWASGPANSPMGAIIVPAGDNTSFNFNQPNTTFWFAPGEHTLGTGEFSQITPGSGSSYIGAPGAILDGKNNNRYAFTGHSSNVRIAYLEIRNFGRGLDNNNEGVINHDSGSGWIMEHLYAHHNDGAAVFVGTDNTVRNSCLKDNGQYGFSMFKPQVEGDSAIKNIVIDTNEVSGNNQDGWEALIPGCGCTGGGKFWDVQGATVTNNYVHDNLSTGLWADTNDTDFLFDSNWIEHNVGEGIWYEISYNATISRNVLKRNAWATGIGNQGSPAPAIYISESGGDSRLASSVSGSNDLRINNNLLEDNFSGISIFENTNRFCNSNGNTSKTYCTRFISPTIIPAPYDYDYLDPINASHPCYTNIASAPYRTDCRWHSKNVQVFNNEFRFDEANVPCVGGFCGAHALFATGADNLPWMPYTVAEVQNDVMFNNNNKFYNNTYIGNWKFAKRWGETIAWNVWRTAPYNQDVGSTFDDNLPPVTNALDANTATLEGSIGQWQAWFSDTVERSSADAHTGTYSLRVNITAGGSWGIQLANFPGFTATPGSKNVSFWAKQGTGAVPAATLRVKWLNGAQTLAQTDLIPITLTTSWQQVSATLTAPADTATVFLEITNGTGGIGNTVYFDDFIVGDNV